MPAIDEKPPRSAVRKAWQQFAAVDREHPKPVRPKLPALSPDDVDRLAVRVIGRLAGHLRGLRIVVRDDGVVLQGWVRSYYAKQLVQEAVMNATDVPIAENAIEIV